MLVHPSLPPTHGTGRDHTDKIITDGKHNEEEPACVRVPQGIIPWRDLGALPPFDDHQWAVEEDLLSLALGHLVLDPILLPIPLVPLEASALCKVICHGY
jgi:hypothetical protein